jgi:hypothetical protein
VSGAGHPHALAPHFDEAIFGYRGNGISYIY